jgi:hypothetical protein
LAKEARLITAAKAVKRILFIPGKIESG